MNAPQQALPGSKAALPTLGLREFWYPALLSKKVGKKPVPIKMLGEEIAFFRDDGKVYALYNRCPHRGLPLSCGRREFPGTLTCLYHGWTFNTAGECVAALNEGPQSSIPGRVKVRSYPTAEINGVIFVYMGNKEPRPLEEDIPEELMTTSNIVHTHIEEWNCSWMPALENLQDSHDIFVHRRSLFYLFRKLPSWATVGVSLTDDGRGVDIRYDKMGPAQAEYETVGKYPRQVWWRRFKINSPRPGQYPKTELRLPGVVRIGFSDLMYVRWAVPVDADHVRAFLFTSRHATGLNGFVYRLYYAFIASWIFLRFFIGQDKIVFEKQDYSAPERLSQTDTGVIRWRRLVAEAARQEAGDDAIEAKFGAGQLVNG
ncbi:nitrite reductase/ring-hydroxylating ferredoxin subunit [Sphingomonas vulcanisoli]|uniref:Nitrite reductase/ring-hydroxylating ferredoxin subunit n=1 Tax=Sphingomonas vulcanisoli TaxID=1658060 RepID=A0ABX0TTG6_9SPHN|nr:aromatic ring-hydroxylating dioxygenase subunit alpha [Sphingomonas vulcanisoli]NIJ08751.1 nitrite reductase/ring-hydroxylating ferredoxin subunit [Sphingomonas vulcanisoli]